ncbi:MAG: fumarate hydratase, partial [Planctomycetota bacterium]
MNEIPITRLQEALYDCIRESSFNLGTRETHALEQALSREENPTARAILQQLLENRAIAAEEQRPLCQDTGVSLIFLEIGQEVMLTDGDLEPALQETVRTAYRDLYLRKSMVRHPLHRDNTGDNTPAIIHSQIVPGHSIRLTFDAKGGGCENMSRIAMLPPSAGRDGVLDFVVESVIQAGGNPCPPVIVGVGLGGTFEKAALLAKQALLRPLGDPAAASEDASLEGEILKRINDSGVGPMGLGGTTTA